jgi:poly(A) polymerase
MNVTQKPHLHQDWIDPHAIGIVRALQKAGHQTYLVGGCVRDLLIGIHPKDFDIATTARPEEVKRLIHRSYVIGKRFRLVLVRRDDVHFEVATFRREVGEDEVREDLPAGDNVFGSAEEDARRRDFTINGLFYDPIGDELIDFAEGMPDLKEGVVRMIGDPRKRLAEDPIRILRALRLKHMISFALDTELRQAMQEFGHTLPNTVLPRRREEILKLLRLKHPDLAFREAADLGLLEFLSPTLAKLVASEAGEDFYLRLRQIGELRSESATPMDLFGELVHSYVRAVLQPDPSTGPRAREVLDDETFQKWMRDELGMFKYEQALAVKALSVEPLLAKRKEFQRRGERRQRALLTNDAFPLALRFAEADYCLSCDDLLYWTDNYQRLREQNPMDQVRHKRRRPRRRRSGGGGGPKNAEARN